MIGHPADPGPVRSVRDVVDSELLGDRGDDRLEDVGGEDGGHPLEAGGRTLQAHTGVDVLLRERFELAGSDPVELGEDQVPDLDFFRSVAVIEDFRAGPQTPLGPWSRCAGRPELSSSPRREIRLAGTLTSLFQMLYASSSSR